MSTLEAREKELRIQTLEKKTGLRRETIKEAVAKMDTLIAKGWHYSWHDVWNHETKTCCLGGAWKQWEYPTPAPAIYPSLAVFPFHQYIGVKLSQTAINYHNHYHIPLTDWARLKARLQEDFGLA